MLSPRANSMPITIEVNETDIEILMRECHTTRDEAIRILSEVERTKVQYQAYLESNLDPRD